VAILITAIVSKLLPILVGSCHPIQPNLSYNPTNANNVKIELHRSCVHRVILKVNVTDEPIVFGNFRFTNNIIILLFLRQSSCFE